MGCALCLLSYVMICVVRLLLSPVVCDFVLVVCGLLYVPRITSLVPGFGCWSCILLAQFVVVC
jgi:hypothetical protein